MAFSSQFSLSLELTRLLPIGKAANKAAEAVMNLARELQNSGSDIIVEEDLAEIFGRCRIARQMESTFRAVISSPGPTHEICDGLVLENSPGPTVSRSLLKGQSSYFSTIIQCSFLSTIHDRDSLASAIIIAMEQRLEKAPPESRTRSIPSHGNVLGVLTACEEQTARFDWLAIVHAVGAQLSMNACDMPDPLHPAVLRGLTLLLPYVQSLPEDREILVHTNTGICTLVVWAHHVLGFNVMVRKSRDFLRYDNDIEETIFGVAPATVTIDCTDVYDSASPSGLLTSVTLIEASSKDTLFSIVPEPEEDLEITSMVKRPVRAYGLKQLDDSWTRFVALGSEARDEDQGHKACVREVTLVAVALALRLSKHIYKVKSPCYIRTKSILDQQAKQASNNPKKDLDCSEDDTDTGKLVENGWFKEDGPNHCGIPETKILEAARVLFDQTKLSRKDVTTYFDAHQTVATQNIPVPATVVAACKQYGYLEDGWTDTLLRAAVNVAVLMLILAHASDLNDAAGLLINENASFLRDQRLMYKAWGWDGEEAVTVMDDEWFMILATLMIGRSEFDPTYGLKEISLLSDRGWSIYIPTFGKPDPSDVVPGSFVIKPGVPSRNGIRKRCIIDAPTNSIASIEERWTHHTAESEITLSRGIPTLFSRPFCGEKGDAFLVSLRLEQEQWKHKTIRRSGFREIFDSVWTVIHTSQCSHSHLNGLEVLFSLPAGACAIALQGDNEIEGPTVSNSRVVICLTANNAAARWRSLIAIQSRVLTYPPQPSRTLLRTRDCCCLCAIQQALLQPEKCFLIL